MTRTTPRKARRLRRCDGCKGQIIPGSRYLEHVASPDHEDLGNVTWWRLAECGECAERYGRAIL
jgi:hypothetical protein